MSNFTGTIQSVVFDNPAESFYILRILLDSVESRGKKDLLSQLAHRSQTVTVKGKIPGLVIREGVWFGFQGKWTNHPQHGRQIQITRAPIFGEWTPETVFKTLVAHGVPSQHIKAIRDHFGDDDFVEKLKSAKELEEVPDLTPLSAQHVAERWRTVVVSFKTMEFLNDLNLPKFRITQITEHFGDDVVDILSQDPWRLVEVDGVSFRDAEDIGHRLGLNCSISNDNRTKGAVLAASKSGQGMGDVYSLTGDIHKIANKWDSNITPQHVGKFLVELHKEGKVVIDRKTKPGLTAVYTPFMYTVEQDAASMLARRMKTAKIKGKGVSKLKRNLLQLLKDDPLPRTPLRKVVGDIVEKASTASNIQLSQNQKDGVINAIVEPVSIITGLPGTGKTTSLRMAVKVLQDAGLELLLVAPTGIAAKRVMSVTGAVASTIHRAFSASGVTGTSREASYSGVTGSSRGHNTDGSEQAWEFSPENPHPADVVIVDEASMVDQHIMYRLMHCTKDTCRIVFVGDAAQLPSVGPGNVLRDLIHCNLFPMVNLTQIFRQKNMSDIVRAAHDIHAGKYPDYEGSTDFRLIQISDQEQIYDMITEIGKRLYDRRENFQILSPRHAGSIGVTNLNERLREMLNPKQPGAREMRVRSQIVREQDRTMVVKNDYKLGVFNGDVGKIAHIDFKARKVELKIHGPPVIHVSIPFHRVSSHLRMAYAITVHKSQGLEYDIIVMPIHDSFRQQLQRNLIYTAITRAKKKVILVGTASALAKAVKNSRESLRKTLFQVRLENELS